MKNKIIYDMSVEGATRAGAYVFAVNIHEALEKHTSYSVLTYKNPFSSIGKTGVSRKLNSILRLLYMELIVFFGDKRDILFFPAPEVPFLAIILKRKYIVTIYDLYAWKNSKETTLFAKIRNKLISYFVKNATFVCTISDYSKKEINDLLNISFEKIFILPIGLDKVFLKSTKYDPIEKLKNTKYLLNVGSLEPRKNISFLIDVFEAIKLDKNFQDLKLVLTASESWNSTDTINKINSSKFKDDIFILGHISQEKLPSLYQNASIMVFPSKAEGFGIPVIEALSQGTPVIVQENTALTEFDQYGASVLNDFNINNWTKKSIDILKNLERVNEDHIQKIQNDFSWEKSAKEFCNFLDSTGFPK